VLSLSGHHDHLQAMCTAAEAPLVATGGKDGQVCFNVCMYLNIFIYMHTYICIGHKLQAMCTDAEASLVATGGKDGQVCFRV